MLLNEVTGEAGARTLTPAKTDTSGKYTLISLAHTNGTWANGGETEKPSGSLNVDSCLVATGSSTHISHLPSNESPGLLCFCRQHFYGLRLARFEAACHRAALLICCLDAARFGPNEAMWKCQRNTDQTHLWTELVWQDQGKRWIREKKKVKNVIFASGFFFSLI